MSEDRSKELSSHDNHRQQLEAATFRRLLKHLDEHKDVQNIDLMNLASFCRNCLAKWYSAEAHERGQEMDYDAAREVIYGMPYDQWKAKYQRPATQEQLEKRQQASTQSQAQQQ